MVEVRKNEERQRYEAMVDGQVAGFAEYRPVGNAMMLPHTEVDSAHEGGGVGSALARHALDDIRSAGKQVIPMCPFIAAYIRRHPEYVDLIHPQQRGVFGV